MTGYDKVTQASLNGIYVKAQELDRGHNDADAPTALPAGSAAFHAQPSNGGAPDVQSHASTHASDSEPHASDSETHASTNASDSEPHASANASDSEPHASTHASDSETHAFGA